jgi:ATP-dependent Clp protease ATP-binding subunit ClpX
MDGVKLTFKDETLDFIVDKAIEYKLGARGLRSIVETIMVDAMFEIPSQSIKKFEVTPEYAAAKLEASGFEAVAAQNNI